jgi:hypothetical protein
MPLSSTTTLDKFWKFYKKRHFISIRVASLRRGSANGKKIVKQIIF